MSDVWGTVYQLERDKSMGNDPESLRREIERLRLGLAGITDPTVTDIGELKNMARELLGWPALETPPQT